MRPVHAFEDDALGDLDAVALADAIKSGRLSRAEAVEAAIARTEAVNPALNGLAFTLLAFGAHLPSPNTLVVPKDPVEAQVSAIGRAEQVRSFVEAYRKRHGRDPTFSDVRNDLKLPPSTASVYLRKALA